jgi:N-acetylglucosaminyldiphosphoundecaprenol N-acetyl-beta-D-mannosaminyltransferase
MVAKILGVQVHDISRREILGYIVRTVQSKNKVVITNVNVHALNLAYEIPWFREFLNQADLNFCDGFGIKLAARLLGTKIKYRNTPPDWIYNLCSLCVEHHLSIFLLGGKPCVSEKAAQNLIDRYPGLIIAGTHHGYFNHRKYSHENKSLLATVKQAHPNILIVGFGMPLQEQWISENWECLDVNVALPVGAMIDYVAGEVIRAPRWITDHGLEWLGRLIIEPRRLWRRYILGNPIFLWRVVNQRLGLIR